MSNRIADIFSDAGNQFPITSRIILGRGAIPKIYRDEAHCFKSMTSIFFGIPLDAVRIILDKRYMISISPDAFSGLKHEYDSRAIGFYHSGQRTLHLQDGRALKLLPSIFAAMNNNDSLNPASGMIYKRNTWSYKRPDYVSFVPLLGQRREVVFKQFAI